MKKASIFTNGKNQAIRIPKDMEFRGANEVMIEQQGDALVLTPVRPSWTSFAEIQANGTDFQPDRADQGNGDRVQLD